MKMTIKFNCDCGFSWEKGRSGQHNCSPFYRETIDGLNLALKQNDDEIKNSESVRASIAALTDARTNGLINENNELKAMTGQLRKFCTELSMEGAQEITTPTGRYSGDETYNYIDAEWIDDAKSVLAKTPAQCLQSVKADAVKAFGHKIGLYDSEYDDQEYIEVSRNSIRDHIEQLCDGKS